MRRLGIPSAHRARFAIPFALGFTLWIGFAVEGSVDPKPGAPIDYRPFAFYPDRWEQRKTGSKMYPWSGKRIVFLTTKKDLKPSVMRRFIERLDEGWRVYESLVGAAPRPYLQLEDRAMITAVPDASLTCGLGCGFVGSTGIEIGGFYDNDYRLVVNDPEAFPHYYFYEMGRNFYVFGERHSAFVTGFAVFMRYVCMDSLKCTDPDRSTRETIERCESLLARSEIPFLRAFTQYLDEPNEKAHRLVDGASPVIPSDQPVLYASAMRELWKSCGGNPWLKRFFATLMTCPEVELKSKESALMQSFHWLFAASIAARRDLSPYFVDRWRMPLSDSTRKLLQDMDWEKAEQDPAQTLASLTIKFNP